MALPTRTMLVLPFWMPELNWQVFLWKEVTIPHPMPAQFYLGMVPETAETDQDHLILGPAHLQRYREAPEPLSRGPVYDAKDDIHYVILEEGRDPETWIPHLTSKEGWSNAALHDWLVRLIQRPGSDVSVWYKRHKG